MLSAILVLAMFDHYVCWETESASAILRSFALDGESEARFMATHSPITGLVISGTEAYDVAEATEEGLLEALKVPSRRHAMCVVEGEAGSGKSHLIRWLKVKWPKGNDLVVLIERADGTLDGTLRQLKDKLAGEASASLEAIVPRHKLTDQGQRESLLLQLGILCRSGTLAEPLGDEDWCERHGLPDLLQSEAVRTIWKAPERVLQVLTQGEDRNSKIARFTARDILELRQPLAGLKGRNVGPGAIRLAQRLRDETQAVEAALENTPHGHDDVELTDVAPTTSKFISALNARLGLAIQSAMGISGAALQKMFRDLRRTLKGEGRRLVLLLEDITCAQGVDQELIYALQERSASQDEFCDIVSIVGITPGYYRQHLATQANVIQRITHHIRFGKTEGSFQAVSALEGPSEQLAFAARYLRAVRAGMASIEQAALDQVDVANRCDSCQHRQECLTAFGENQGVGYYPLTAKAIVQMFASLRDPEGAMLLQTPRALIQAVLAPSLFAGNALKAGNFPVPVIETDWHPVAKREVRGLAHDLIENMPEGLRERLRITVAWWGDGGFPLQGNQPGTWAGVPEGVFRAWDLVPPTVAAPPPLVPEPPEPEDLAGAPEPKRSPSPKQPDPTKVNPAPRTESGKRTGPKPKFEEQINRIRNWLRTKKIEDDGFWSGRVEQFIKQLGWKNEDLPSWYLDEMLGVVQLYGSGQTGQRNVVIPCEPWAARGLEWSVLLEYGQVSTGEHEIAIQAISVFAHRLRLEILAWITSRVPDAKPGLPWEFGATIVQVLLVRAWLRGETWPGAPLTEQWKVILSDDSPKGAMRRPLARNWNNAVESLAADSNLRKRLRVFSDANGVIANVTLVAPAIQTLAREATFAPFPAEPPEQTTKTKWLNSLTSSALVASTALADLPRREVLRLRDYAMRVLEITGAAGFTVYLTRAAIAFGSIRKELPSHTPDTFSEWFRLFEGKKKLLEPGPGSENENLQEYLTGRTFESLPEDSPIPVQLDHAIQAPGESLESLHGLVKCTATLVDELVSYLEPHETSSANLDPVFVTAFGKTVADKAAELKAEL